MKHYFRLLVFLSLLLTHILTDAATGSLFTVNARGPVVTVGTVVPNHIYPAAGLKITTPGYQVATSDCERFQNNACLFTLSSTSPKSIAIEGPNGIANFILCLNGEGQITCENHSARVSNQKVTGGIATPVAGDAQAQIYRMINGQNWEVPTIFTSPAGTSDNSLRSVACSPSGASCALAGFNGANPYQGLIYTTTNGGSIWSNAIQPSRGVFNSIQLWGITHASEASRCLSIGNSETAAIAYASANCTSWASNPITVYDGESCVVSGTCSQNPLPTLNAVDCDSTGTNCVAVGFFFAGGYFTGGLSPALVARSTNSGATWTSSLISVPSTPAGLTRLVFYGVSCSATSQRCVAMGFAGDASTFQLPVSYTSTDGGATWSGPVYLPQPSGNLYARIQSVFCNDTGLRCVGAGMTSLDSSQSPSDSVLYYTTNGGLTWSNPIIPARPTNSDNNILFGVTCSSTGGLCTATGNGTSQSMSYSSVNGGVSWTGPVLMPLVNGYTRSEVFGVSGSG